MGSQSSDVSLDCRFTVGSPSVKCGSTLMRLVSVMAILLTVGVGQLWGAVPGVSDLNWGTPALTLDFNSVANVPKEKAGSGSSTTSSSSLSGYGGITHCYIGKSASDKFTVKAAASPMSSQYLETTTTTKGCVSGFTRTFKDKGAYSFVIAKTSITFIGLYAAHANASSDFYAKAKSSVYLYFTGSKIQINSGSGWVDAVSDMTDLPNVFEVRVVYNNSSSSATYNGGNTSLGAKRAHIYVNGSAIPNAGGTAPKDFTIPGATLTGFRIGCNVAGTSKVDDIKIYDALPTAAGTSVSLTKAGQTNGSFTLTQSSSPVTSVTTTSAAQAVTVTATPATGYYLSNLTASNPPTGTASVTGSGNTRTVTYTQGANGSSTITSTFSCLTPTISIQPAASTSCLVGASPELSVTAAAGGASLNYQWKQCATVDGTYVNVASGGTSSTYSPSTASAGTTYYKCVITNAASGCSTTVTSDPAEVTVNAGSTWKFKYSGDSYDPHTMDEAAGVASYSLSLAADTRYEFGFDDNGSAFYKNQGTIITTTSGWVFNTTDNNCKIHTGPAGTYTFAINTTTKAVTVTYPTVSHPNEHYVYFKNTNVWGTVYGYLANSGNDNKAAAWPGSVMQPTTTICGETYHYAALNAMSGTYNVINFNDGGSGYGHQTSDLSTTGSLGKYNANQDASWHQFKYSISFAGNGNTDGSMSSITELCPGSNQALTSNAFTKTHYTFAGWHADVAVKVGESTIDAGDMIEDAVTIKDIQSDIALTAQWAPDTYTITKTFSNVANAGLPASFTYTGAATTALNSTFTVDATNFFLPSSIAVTMGGTPLTAGTDYTYNNSTGAFTFSAVITGNIVITATATAKLKSIAITTQPTTRAYLVGDVFSSTGAVVTATMGDGSTKAVTASATWTPAGALSAGTSQTVTATYTEAGIEKTATTTIDVYSVTVNKVDMDGNAIADAGVTASCSGRTLSQSVSTTNYKFNSWVLATASGTSLSTNTLTGTPTGNVVVNAKFHKPITVTWKVGSGAASGSPTTEVKYNTAITALPSTPADNALASCGTNKFMGWTALGELKGTGDDAPADLFTTVGGATALTENTTYRAVFANGSGSGSEGYNKVTSTGNITNDGRYLIVYESGNVAFNGNLTTLDASSNVVTATVSTSAIAVNDDNRTTLANAEFSIDMTNKYIKSHSNKYINYNSYGGGLTASADATEVHSISIDGSGNLVIEGTGQNSSSPYDYVVLQFNSNTGSGNWRFRFYKGTQQAIQLYKYDPGTTYSDYQTGCCKAPASALSITSANSVATGGTVSLTSTGGNGGTVTWSVVNGTGSATIEGTTLTAGSVGTVTVKAHQDANTVLGTEYCAQDAEQAFTVVSATVNVTGVTVDPTTKAIVPGETFTITPTISPSNATDKSVSWTSSASDKASVSSGTVTGVAAGTATITCTTTDGSKTATTAVTVYGFTVLAQDEDGTDISGVSGITASHTGKALSAGVGSTKYVFKTWKYATGGQGGLDAIPSATSTSTTLTGTPTGDVTVIAEFYKPRVIKWSVNGDDSYATGEPTTTVAYNGTISAVPTAPADNTLSCTNKFMGWSTKDAGTTPKTTSYYDDLFTNASGYTTNITAATTTFYAVFAEAETGAWTLDYSKETALSSSTDWGSYGTAYDYTASDGGTWTVKAYKNSGMQINTGKDASIKIPDCSGNITSIVITCSAAKAVGLSASDYTGSGDITYIAYGTDATSQTIDCSSKTATGGYIVPKGGSTSITKIVVNYGSTSDYVTQCDPNQVRVTYDANGGSTSCTNTTTDKTEDFTVCSSAPTKDYYSFAGWLCSADDEVYAASATIPAAAIDADFSLTAQWTPVTYNITYNLHGGTTAGGNPTTYDVETATIDLADGTYGHNRFEGWYSTYNDGTGAYSDQVTSIPLGSHGDITLHAKWTTRHEIVFDADGETTTIYRADDEAMDASVAGQGSVPSDPSAPSTCSTKVFVGWSESEIDDETNTRPGDLMKSAEGKVDEDKHYYAVWALRAGSPAPATYAGTGTFVKITSMSEVETDTYYVLRGIDGSTVNVMKNTISSGKMGTADDPVSENVITNPGVAIVWKLGGKKDAYTLYNQSVSKYVEITGNSTGGYALNASPTSGATYTLTIEDGHGFFFKSNYSTANSRGISIYNASEFRSYGLANAKTLELYKLPAYTYSAYSTSCCETKVNLTHNSPEHGTVEFNKSRIGTCNSDKEVSLTIIPDVGYQLTGWTVNTSSGYADAKTTSPAVVTNSNNSAAQNITLTFAEDANKDYDVTATFGLMTVSSWAWTLNSAAIPDPLNLYVGQSARLDVAYTPAGVDNSKKTYERTKVDAYINWVGGLQATYSTISGKASTGENTTAVTFTHADGPTTTVNVKVLPLPLVHFGDIVHNVEFADVVATLSDNTLSPTKTTPTHADFDGATKNTCEEQHLHLVGWIREDWPALVTYLNGGAQPSTSDITTAGVDASGNAYFFAPGASINTQTFNGVTFYAVWAKVE